MGLPAHLQKEAQVEDTTSPPTPDAGIKSPKGQRLLKRVLIASVIAAFSAFIFLIASVYWFASIPQAIVAQVDTGTALTAPTKCPTGDHVYVATINGREGMELVNGTATPGKVKVWIRGTYDRDSGSTSSIALNAETRSGDAPKPVIDSVYAWSPLANTTLNTAPSYEVVRYAVPKGTARVQLEPAKAAFNSATVVFACLAPDGAR